MLSDKHSGNSQHWALKSARRATTPVWSTLMARSTGSAISAIRTLHLAEILAATK